MSDNQKSTKAALLSHIDRFLRDNPEMTETNFGWKTVKQASLIERLRNGGDITTEKLDKIMQFLVSNTNNGVKSNG